MKQLVHGRTDAEKEERRAARRAIEALPKGSGRSRSRWRTKPHRGR